MSNLLSEFKGHARIFTLDRPEALNSLNLEMVRALGDALDYMEAGVILIKGAGGRAFCAGGDIKAARLGAMAVREGRMDLEKVAGFFVEEYALNKKLFHFSRPIVSFMNGITMGGGVGIAGACKFRVATEKTIWAMPEVSIGFFPDVGAAYYLSRAPDSVGKYLGLTGLHLSNAADLINCGFATHYIPSDREEQLIEGLKNPSTILADLHVDPGSLSLPYEKIGECFCSDTIEEILENLAKDGSAWASETDLLIRSKSPTSVKVALRHIQMAETEEFDEVIARDLILAGKFLQGHDLIEGVRAMVVDKNKSPKWNPERLEDVGIRQVEDYFN